MSNDSHVKKRIIILSHWLEIGGVERSLIELLKAIDCDRYDVDLYLCRHSGELMSEIPDKVKLLPEDKKAAAIAKPISYLLKKPFTYRKIIFARIFAKIRSKSIYKSGNDSQEQAAEMAYVHKYAVRAVKKINPDVVYDAALSFLAPHYICLYKVNALKKIAWIHTDYGNIDVDVNFERSMWEKYDVLAAVSESCIKSFNEKFEDLGNEMVCVENILSSDFVVKASNQMSKDDVYKEIKADKDDIVLCTVGRFSYQKRIDGIPEICRMLTDSGYKVKWMIIGYGPDESLITKNTEAFNVRDSVCMLGKKTNPYPYMSACDIYVQPSRYEGKAVTVREAQMLGKAVLITHYETADSQVKHGIDGIIVDNNTEACAHGIAALYGDREMMARLSENCKKNDFSNSEEVEKLYKLMGVCNGVQ